MTIASQSVKSSNALDYTIFEGHFLKTSNTSADIDQNATQTKLDSIIRLRPPNPHTAIFTAIASVCLILVSALLC